MKRFVLSVDIGTSSLKAALIDESGFVRANTRCRFPHEHRSAQHWIDAFVNAFRALAETVSPQEFMAISISGNGPTLVSLDPDGRASGLLLWNDPIPSGDDRGASKKAGAASVAGEAPESQSIFIPRLAAFRARYPGAWENARFVVSGPEYLIWCLTGNPITILPEPRYAAAYWTDDDLSRAGLASAKLPPFAPIGAIAGVTGSHGEFLPPADLFPPGFFDFLPAGLPVIAGGPDFIVALIGTGTLEGGKACDRAGTSEGLNVCTEKPTAHRSIRPLPSVIGGLWNAAYLLPETGAIFHAWRKRSGQATRSYPEIMRDIELSPIVPAPGETLDEGRDLVEKIGFSVRKGIETLRESTGLDPVFALSGGQARNEIWNRMKSDITGAVFSVMTTPDGELMGDAIVAFTALGVYGSLREAARNMVRVIQVFEPDPFRHALYSEKYLRFKHEGL